LNGTGIADTVGELEEAHADLEASKRQLATLRSEDVPTPSATPTGGLGNGGEATRESFSGATCQLEAGLEEAKVLTPSACHFR